MKIRPGTCWQVLGIARTRERGDIRRAYAAKLKTTNPEDDAAGFQALRAAYEQALAYADGAPGRQARQYAAPPRSPPSPPPPAPPLVTPRVEPNTDAPPAETMRGTPHSGGSDPDMAPGPLPPAPPPAPDPRDLELAAYHARRETLYSLLRPNIVPDVAVLDAAFNALVRSEAMTMLDIRDQTEGWIAWILVSSAPRGDSLLVTAIRYFGWSTRHLDRHATPAVQHVLARANGLAALEPLLRKGGIYYQAWKVLSAPRKPVSLFQRLFGPTPYTVKALLDTLHRQYGGLQTGFDPQTVALWQAWLQRPRLKSWMLWLLLGSLPCAVLIALVLRSPSGGLTETQARMFYLGLVVAAAMGSVLWHFAHEWPAHLWRTKGTTLRQNPWLTLGWAPAAIAALALSTVPVLWVGVLADILAVTIAFWASVTGEGDRRTSNMPWFLRGVQAYIVPLLWLAVIGLVLARHGGIMTSIAAMAAVATFICGKMSLHRLWASLDRGRQSVAILVGAGICVACGVLCSIGLPASVEPGWAVTSLALPAVAMVTTVAVLCRLPVLDNEGFSFNLIVMRGIGLFIFAVGSIGLPFLGGLATVVWCLYCLTRAWQEHRKPLSRSTPNI